ncbi:hypothetical protein E2C01_048324 [Portunus trituberculatus]|uniref:Uncharacterized protein n=1 Tax=Portunus trituberculatus TaxID=210409 RepID=A0A5B7GA87_PORTR|nr:hypothetical protein [Portunus trituberculatus]
MAAVKFRTTYGVSAECVSMAVKSRRRVNVRCREAMIRPPPAATLVCPFFSGRRTRAEADLSPLRETFTLRYQALLIPVIDMSWGRDPDPLPLIYDITRRSVVLCTRGRRGY